MVVLQMGKKSKPLTRVYTVFNLASSTGQAKERWHIPNCECGDGTQSIWLVLWKVVVGKLHEGSSYRLTRVTVALLVEFIISLLAKLRLQKRSVTLVVLNKVNQPIAQELPQLMLKRKPSGVSLCDHYSSCLVCKFKVSPTSDTLGEYTKCEIWPSSTNVLHQ